MQVKIKTFQGNCFLLVHAVDNQIIKPMTHKQALRLADNDTKKLMAEEPFIWNPPRHSAKSLEKHAANLKAQYDKIEPFYDKNRTIRDIINIS